MNYEIYIKICHTKLPTLLSVTININKRAKIALNRSTEFYSSNTKPGAVERFGILIPPFEQTLKSSTIQCSIPYFKHLSQVVLKQTILFIFSYVFLWFEPRTPWHGAILELGPCFEQTW